MSYICILSFCAIVNVNEDVFNECLQSLLPFKPDGLILFREPKQWPSASPTIIMLEPLQTNDSNTSKSNRIIRHALVKQVLKYCLEHNQNCKDAVIDKAPIIKDLSNIVNEYVGPAIKEVLFIPEICIVQDNTMALEDVQCLKEGPYYMNYKCNLSFFSSNIMIDKFVPLLCEDRPRKTSKKFIDCKYHDSFIIRAGLYMQ